MPDVFCLPPWRQLLSQLWTDAALQTTFFWKYRIVKILLWTPNKRREEERERALSPLGSSRDPRQQLPALLFCSTSELYKNLPCSCRIRTSFLHILAGKTTWCSSIRHKDILQPLPKCFPNSKLKKSREMVRFSIGQIMFSLMRNYTRGQAWEELTLCLLLLNKTLLLACNP